MSTSAEGLPELIATSSDRYRSKIIMLTTARKCPHSDAWIFLHGQLPTVRVNELTFGSLIDHSALLSFNTSCRRLRTSYTSLWSE